LETRKLVGADQLVFRKRKMNTTQSALILATSYSPTPYFWGCAPKGTMTIKFELGRDFCTVHLPRVSSSCVYSFIRYRVDKQTNKHTDAAENIEHSSLRYDVG